MNMAKFKCLLFFVYLFPGFAFSKNNLNSENLFNHISKSELLETTKLVWVLPVSRGFQTTIRLFEKLNNQWIDAGIAFPAVIGKKGLAALNEKIEGDMKTPQGLFDLKKVYGKQNYLETGLKYEIMTKDFKWIDDVNSPDYNKLVIGPTHAQSYETMYRDDELYDLVTVIEYNTAPIIKNKGSAIFMHLWRNSNQGTAGCIALSRSDITQILKWLDQRNNSKILLGSTR